MRDRADLSRPNPRFRRIVDYARKRNPFYAEWIRDPDRIPILDRKTFIENNDRILDGNKVIATTSGSTGMPVRIAKSPDSTAKDLADIERMVEWLGGRLPVVEILHHRDKRPHRSHLDINTPVPEQMEYLRRSHKEWGACAIITYPTNGVMLAQHATDKGMETSFIKRFGFIGESFTSSQRDQVQQVFPNAQVWSSYSSMEFGMIALQCPHEPDFHHIMSHKLFVEVLDEEDQPCEDGKVGRLVITDYFNTACPFIRYELGDLAAFNPCPCGWIQLPAFGAIHGKVRGALLHRSGRRVMFTDLSISFCAMPEVKQYQVIQESLEDFTVKLVATENIDKGVHEAFVEHFGYAPNLSIEYLDFIPREKSGKFHAAICKV